MTKPKRTEEEILSELVEVRQGLAERKSLLARQNALYIEGFQAGIPKARLASAGGDKLKRGEAAVYQVIRKWQTEQEAKKAARTAKKT